jgi:hypothetical protein
MSALSTITISRSKAMALALEYIAKASNDQLARLADYPLAGRLFNCRVVPDGEPNDDERLA